MTFVDPDDDFVRVTADGDVHELLSNELNVVEDMPVVLAACIRWKDLVFTGSDPVVFGVTEYDFLPTGQYREGLSKDLLAIPSPAIDSDSSNVDDFNFVRYETDYTVPNDGTVDQIRMRLKIGANATGGTVDWTKCEMIPNTSIRDAVVPGIGQTVDDITNKLYNLDQTGWTHDDSANALGQQTDTVKANAMAISILQAQLTPGVYTYDNFSRTGSTLGADWDVDYSTGLGGWAVNGSDAYWDNTSAYGARESLCRWVGAAGTVSTSDYQVIKLILSSAATRILGTIDIGHNDVICRLDSAKQNYIRFRISAAGTWSLSKFIAGVETVMDSGITTAPGAGSVLAVICGDYANLIPRSFTAIVGATVVASGVTDTTSNFGASYRGWGFGGRAEGTGTAQAIPGAAAQWTALDSN